MIRVLPLALLLLITLPARADCSRHEGENIICPAADFALLMGARRAEMLRADKAENALTEAQRLRAIDAEEAARIETALRTEVATLQQAQPTGLRWWHVAGGVGAGLLAGIVVGLLAR